MRLARLFQSRMMTSAVAMGALVLMTGCPVAQQPTAPPPAEPNDTTPPPPSTPDDGIDRPVTPPPAAPNDGIVDSGSGTPPPPVLPPPSGGGGSTPPGGGGGGGPGSSFFQLDVTAPGDDLRLRPGLLINIAYELVDPDGVTQSISLVVSRDDNLDGEPDGAAIFSQPVSFATGEQFFGFNTATLSGFLNNGFGSFVVGLRALRANNAAEVLEFASGSLIVDAQAPTGSWVGPTSDLLTNPVPLTIDLNVVDNSATTVTVALDEDLIPGNGELQVIVPPTTVAAGSSSVQLISSLSGVDPGKTYNYLVTLSDGIAPDVTFYGLRGPGDPVRLALTNRLIGDFDLSQLTSPAQNRGAVVSGFNFNDLAGSSMVGVPDLNGDNRDELMVASRFGKAYIIENNGVGFGEAYMLYGSAANLAGTLTLNSVGNTLPGLIFPGIRTPRSAPGIGVASTRWTSGLSDIAVVPDMDGDDLPELVFSFPRVESINLGETTPTIQHPELAPDIPGMGALEFNAFVPVPPAWTPNVAQFTRGGIVIVSSQNELLQNPSLLNRKSDRVLDLHEVGQLFGAMARPSLVPYLRQAFMRTDLPGPFVCADCDGQPPDGWDPGDPGEPGPDDDQPGNCGDDACDMFTPGSGSLVDGREEQIARWVCNWDVVFNNQGPGGFHQPWTAVQANPPLANAAGWPFPTIPIPVFPFAAYPNLWVSTGLACPQAGIVNTGCEVTNQWFSWGPTLPGTSLMGTPSWATGGNPFQALPTCYPTNPAITVVPPAFPDPACPPPSTAGCPDPGLNVSGSGSVAWTGFYGPTSVARIGLPTGETFPTPMGARIMGQAVNDRFGTALGADGTWLYISAANRSVNAAPYGSDVPALGGQRAGSGAVYQLRTNAPGADGITRTQLWLERGFLQVPDPDNPDEFLTVELAWPNVDIQDPGRTDYTMPVPHQYIIESVGSIRGNPQIGVASRSFPPNPDDASPGECPPPYVPSQNGAGTTYADPWTAPDASAIGAYTPYPVGTAGFYVDRTPQIVGPHVNANIQFVRALGDVNGDGVRDFAVGSPNIQPSINNPPGGEQPVGAVFIVYGRPPGVEGDYLLEQLSFDISASNRLAGVLVKGANPNETLARVFADAGYFRRSPSGVEEYRDFNGDGFADVIIGNEAADPSDPNNPLTGRGEAIIILGSSTLISPGPTDAGGVPGGGWTPDTIPSDRAVRIIGENAGDLAGANVSSAGDVDNDGFSDVLVAAPGADVDLNSNGVIDPEEIDRGVVYLIYGSANPPTLVNLGDLKTSNVEVPFVRFIGRKAFDFLGGGTKVVTNTSPANQSTTVFSQGLAVVGDLNQDGLTDFTLSSMLADPSGKVDAGEVYVLYGKAGP